MSQVYHSNAKLNQHSRFIIQNSELTNVELAVRFNVTVKTIRKWDSRDFTEEELPLEGIEAHVLKQYIMH